MTISEHFSLAEVQVNPRGGDNTAPPDAVQRAIWHAVDCMEPVRAEVSTVVGADTPWHIDSWYRSYDLNRAVGGEKLSMHRNGEAADGYPPASSIALEDALRAIYAGVQAGRIKVDQAILYPSRGFIHLASTRRRLNRGMFLVSPSAKVYEVWSPGTP